LSLKSSAPCEEGIQTGVLIVRFAVSRKTGAKPPSELSATLVWKYGCGSARQAGTFINSSLVSSSGLDRLPGDERILYLMRIPSRFIFVIS
jgi:hypothetical protein